jgi:hypothetical protein
MRDWWSSGRIALKLRGWCDCFLAGGSEDLVGAEGGRVEEEERACPEKETLRLLVGYRVRP